jgi:hypothetical protein
VTITTFLEGFSRARLQRSIDHVGKHSEALLTELTKAAASFARSEAYKEKIRRDFESPFRLPRSAAAIRYGVWVAVPISAALFALLITGLAGSGSTFAANPAHWNSLFTAALVLFIAQVALAVLTFTDSRDNESELARARTVFVAQLVNEAEITLHSTAPPNVEAALLWADAVAGTEANLPQDDRVRGILQSIEARFHLSAAMELQRESKTSTDTAGVPRQNTALQQIQELDKASKLLAALPQAASTVDSQLAYAVLLSIDLVPKAADTPDAASVLWDAVNAYNVARPPRWLLVHDRLPWKEVIEQHSGKDADVFARWTLGDLAEFLLYADARDPRQRREHCRLAAEALRAAGKSFHVKDALRAMFEACETPDEVTSAYVNLTYHRGFARAAVLVPLIQAAAKKDETTANEDRTWQMEAVEFASVWARDLPDDPIGWMPVIDEVRRSKVSDATTNVLTHAFPGKTATEAMLAWLDLLDKSGHGKAEKEAANLALAWTRDDADRKAVNQQAVDAVVGLLARSSDDVVSQILIERLQKAAVTWTETITQD